jgi:hypothetical protein
MQKIGGGISESRKIIVQEMNGEKRSSKELAKDGEK